MPFRNKPLYFYNKCRVAYSSDSSIIFSFEVNVDQVTELKLCEDVHLSIL